jgi:hypothetical protein
MYKSLDLVSAHFGVSLLFLRSGFNPILLLVFAVAAFLAIRYFFNHGKIPKRPHPSDGDHDPPWPQTNVPIPPSPFGSVFDETVIGRQRADITEEKPTKLLGRIREIRRWEEEAGLFGKKKRTLGFHLDYDRTSKDFGGLLVRLRTTYFKNLKLQDGDELEIDLKWKRPWKCGHIACIKNISSGQRVVPTSVSSKAGILEGVEGGTTRGAM